MATKPLSPIEKFTALGILAFALGLRLYKLDQMPVWCDETYFWEMANHQGWLATLLHTMADDVYPPFYFFILHFIGLFTRSLFLLRLPSALAGAAAVLILMSLLRRRAGTAPALMAGLLAAVSPVMLHYAQEMKMYSILALLLLGLFDETLRVQEDPSRGWKKLALWAALSVYTFYLAVFAWAALLLLSAWLYRKDFRKGAAVWKGYAAASLLFLPWLPFFFKSVVVNRGSVFNFYAGRLPIFSFQNFSIGFWSSDALAWAALLAFGAFAALGLKTTLKKNQNLAVMLAGFAFLPLGLSWAVSLLAKPMYSDRAMLASAFGWLALAALGLASLPKKAALPGLVLLLGLNSAALGRYFADPLTQKVDYRPAWNHILSQWKEGDSLFHVEIGSYYPFRFFARQEQGLGPTSGFQEEPGAALGPGLARIKGLRPNWIHKEPPAFNPNPAAGRVREIWRRFNGWLKEKGLGVYTGYNRDFVAGERLEKEALPGVKRIWYLNTSNKEAAMRAWMPQMNVYRQGIECWWPFEPQKLPWLQKNFKPVSTTTVAEVDLYLFESRKGN